MLDIRTSTDKLWWHSLNSQQVSTICSPHGDWFPPVPFFFHKTALAIWGLWGQTQSIGPFSEAVLFTVPSQPTVTPPLSSSQILLSIPAKVEAAKDHPCVKQVLWQLHFHSLFLCSQGSNSKSSWKISFYEDRNFLKVENPAYTLPTQTKLAFNFFLTGCVLKNSFC